MIRRLWFCGGLLVCAARVMAQDIAITPAPAFQSELVALPTDGWITLDYHAGFGAPYTIGWAPPDGDDGRRGARELPHAPDRTSG